MKRKIILSILVMFFILTLVGCDTIPITDEIKIKNVIQGYFLAISEQNWNKAKSYCLYGLDVYYETCAIEQHINDLALQYGVVTITFDIEISNISIYNINYAEAYITGTSSISYGSISDSSDGSGYIYLQEINNNWKIYDY